MIPATCATSSRPITPAATDGRCRAGPTVWRIRIGKLTATPLPRVLTNTADIAGADAEPDVAGVAWKLDVRDRDLDSNVITLAPNGGIDAHGADVDVLVHVLSGSGRLTTEEGTIELAPVRCSGSRAGRGANSPQARTDCAT